MKDNKTKIRIWGRGPMFEKLAEDLRFQASLHPDEVSLTVNDKREQP
jgi:hypothetical protein